VGRAWVFRLELSNPSVLLAAARRVAATLGKSLPAPLDRGGRSYWRIDRTTLLAIDDRQLVFAGGERYDYKRLVELQGALGLIEGDGRYERELAKIWGETAVTLDIADDGLRLWSTVELAP
jgi:hypothetical protein